MIQRLFKRIGWFVLGPIVRRLDAQLQVQLRDALERRQAAAQRETPGNPAARGFKVYSQADEDGIIEEITGALGIERGTFVEIGCGDGIENNTHYLLLKGWRGVWIDGDANKIDLIRADLPLRQRRLYVRHAFVDTANVGQLLSESLPEVRAVPALDLLSVDIDGNDLQVTMKALEVVDPAVLVVEYNGKLGAVARLSVNYETDFRWAGDDYQGASLAAWVDALEGRYRLVACGLSGNNAFFVRAALADRFASYSTKALYRHAFHELIQMKAGLPASRKFLRDVLEQAAEQDGHDSE
jgi:hypothetical protein